MAVRGENSLFFSSGIDNAGLQRGTIDAVGMVQGMADSISRINPFAVLAVGAAAAFAKIANDAYKMMKDFESAMTEVKTIANVSESEFKKLENQVFLLYKQLGTETPDELARGLYDIIGAGYEAADALHLLEVASKAATAGVTTSAVASDGLTTILNAFRMGVEDATRVADIMFATVDIGKISFEELSTQIAQVAPLAAASGFSFEEIGGAISTLTKQGVPASQAMTQIRSAIVATNEVLGDGVAQTMTLQNAFQLLYEQADGSQNNLKELVGRIEAVNGILSIAGPNFEGATQDLLHMSDAAGSVNRSFDMITGTAANQWEIFGERLRATTKEIGGVILEMSGSIATALNKTLESSEDVRKGFDAQKLELYRLEGALHNVTEGSEDYKAIRDEILRNYPEFLSGIDSETVTTQELLSVLNEVNDAYVQRFKFAQRESELREAYEKQGILEISIEDASAEFEETIAKIRSSTGIELDLSLNDEDLYRQVKELTDDMVGFIGQQTEGQQVLQGQIFRLNDLIKKRQEYNTELQEQRQLIDEIAERNNRYSKADLQTEQGRLEAIRKINEATRESELSQFVDSGVEEVERALQARRDILSNLRKIDQTQSLEELKSYLESENEEVKEYAKARARILNTDYTPQGTNKEESTFTEILKDREQQYKEYTAAVNQLGKEQADEHFQNLLKQGKDYGDYLQRQLDQTTDASRIMAIAVAAENSKINLNRRGISPVNELTSQGIVDFEVDDTSINYIRRRLQQVREEFNAASQADRPDIQPQLDYWEERLRIAQDGAETEKSINEQIRLELRDLGRKGLIDYRKEWQDKLKIAREAGNEIAAIDAEARIEAVNKQIAENTGDTIRETSRSLGDASAMFRKFGEEDLANALDKLSSVGNGIASVVEGITVGGPLGIIQAVGGVFGMLGSLISGGAPKKSEFEKSIERLAKTVDKLSYSLYGVYGEEAMQKRSKAIESMSSDIEALEKQQEDLNKAIEDFENQDNFVAGVASEVLGEGYKQRQEELEGVTEELRSLREEYNELITGTTAQSLTDSIIQGFKEGKKGIADFADTFEETMQDALLRTFQTYYLEGEIADFYKQFRDLGVEGDGYSASDIANLQNLFNGIMEGAEKEMELINQILESAGLNRLGESQQENRQGLSGAISSITEDTANILAGTMNAMRLDIRQGVEIAVENSMFLSEIAVNTRYLENIDRTMTSMDGRIGTIESGVKEFQAQG